MGERTMIPSSLERQTKRDYIRSSVEQRYRMQPDTIDIGSAAGMHLLQDAVMKKVLHSVEMSFAQELGYYPTIYPDSRLETMIAEKLRNALSITISRNQIAIFRGILGGAFCTLPLWKNGKYVIVPENMYLHHKVSFASCGKELIEAPVSENGWVDLLSLRKILQRFNKQVSFLYLYNIFGNQVNELYLQEIGRLLKNYNLYALYDLDVLYTPHTKEAKPWLPLMVPVFSQRALILCNLSKEFGVPGLRISYGIGSEKMIHDIQRFQRNSMEMIPNLNRAIATEIVRTLSTG